MRETVQSILGKHITDEEWKAIQLPGPLGGCSMRLPLTGADAAFYSTWLATKDRVKLMCESLGRPVTAVAAQEEALLAAGRLKSRGVEVSPDARAKFT
eukprot:9357509-Karenia_brevis.AAC.1